MWEWGELLNINDPEAADSDIDVYSNTFYNVRVGWSGGTGVGFVATGLDVYNNIIVTNGLGTYSQISLSDAIPGDFASNYNSHRFLAGSVRFRVPGSVFETLTQWQARGYDLNSLTSDPLFVGSFPATRPSAFQLQSISPARNAGRVGGVSSGAAVSIGAYATGNEVIGIGGNGTSSP